jgi:hypothetical protein
MGRGFGTIDGIVELYEAIYGMGGFPGYMYELGIQG